MTLFDPIRQQWVAATPEEHVRQKWLRYLIDHKGYPPSSMAVEKSLGSLPHLEHTLKDRRFDLIIYTTCAARGLRPFLLAEFKAHNLSKDNWAQLVGYNAQVHAEILLLANHDSFVAAKWDAERYQPLTEIPPY